jgi:hypothetical protein
LMKQAELLLLLIAGDQHSPCGIRWYGATRECTCAAAAGSPNDSLEA